MNVYIFHIASRLMYYIENERDREKGRGSHLNNTVQLNLVVTCKYTYSIRPDICFKTLNQ